MALAVVRLRHWRWWWYIVVVVVVVISLQLRKYRYCKYVFRRVLRLSKTRGPVILVGAGPSA